MTDPNRFQNLLRCLGTEINSAKAGSSQGQFPILDLLGNLRDASADQPEMTAFHATCAEAWERIVVIVESGRPFEPAQIQELQELWIRLSNPAAAAEPAPAPAAAAPKPPPAPAPEPMPAPAAMPAEDSSFVMDMEEDADLLREFIAESREHLDNIEQGVLVLENHPDDAEMLHTIFRAFHTFKGSAGALNLLPINRLAHALESLLDLARQDRLLIDRTVIDLILRGRDVLEEALNTMAAQMEGSTPLAPIHLADNALKHDVLALVARASGEASPAPAPAPNTEDSAPASEIAIPLPLENASAPSAVPALVAPPAPTESRAGQRASGTGIVKVDTTKLDALLDLVGELVIAQSLVAQDLNGLAGLSQQFSRNLAQLSRTTKELQRVSMAMRMVPIRGAFQKMVRVVRDLSAKQHKPVQLLTSGEDTELDRGVVEELNDPLLHMIRNAIDHGIEPPEARAARGKPATAELYLRAYHQGGSIVIEIQDDGAGLNRDRILAKAVERGLVAPNTELTDQDVFSLIFAPGFSTAEKVTDVSGRGVGLDVVRRNVEQLRGCIDVSSTPGQGTLFTITLPLTLAIIDGLIVKVGQERYILPTLSVRESFRAQADMITTVQGVGEVVNVRGRLLPLLRLHDCFGITSACTDVTQGILVVVQSGATCRCLLVDTLLHKQEVVIKNINDLMIHKNRALAGAAILGDGRVGLILDINSLVQRETRSFAQAA